MSAPTTETTDQLRRALSSLRDLRTRFEALDAARHEPIAVVGMACRLPGAPDLEALWSLVRRGGDAVVETPSDRWDADALYDPEPEHAGTVATRWGGFLDDVSGFDASFFGISPREAARMDPQQRLLLEVAWEALEHAGQSTDRLAGSATGVFVGVHSQSDDYYSLQAADAGSLDLYSGTGTSHSVAGGRLSYLLDLHGPSLAIDTACSSSLVAVHLGVQSLRREECSLAVVGGVNAILEPTFTMVASRMRMMSPTGRCRPFDAAADGFVRAEGCGVVVLKRLRDAQEAGDRVLAVVRGSAVNQDGRSNGLTAPNSRSQEAVIRAALDDARTAPEAIGLIEAHGTGTSLGDPIEVEALSAVFGGAAADRGPCALGSLKANVGHAEGAAGVVALIKTVLCLRAGEIPPVVHFEHLNPHIDLQGTPFVVPTVAAPWPGSADGRVAGVSSFGWSGTNAHVVVGTPPGGAVVEIAGPPARPLLLAVSARDPEARTSLAASYGDLLAGCDDAAAASVGAAAALRRAHHPHRLAVSGRSASELVAQLAAVAAGEGAGAAAVGERPVVGRTQTAFVFPGQGSQWPGMARRLLAAEPAFRAALGACAEVMDPLLGWSLVARVEHGDTGRDDVGTVQPTLFAVQVALAALWREWGVQPDVVVGHSMGEVAAAHVAGILSLEDAATVICTRSGLLGRIAGAGAMAVVDLDPAAAAAVLAGSEDRVSIAVSNSPTSTVISGDAAAIDEILDRLVAADVFCRRIKVDVASHSPQVDVLLGDLERELAGIRPRPATVPFRSTVTDRFEDGPGLDAAYWARNLRDPVRFGSAVAALVARGHTRAVEISPHPVLTTAVAEVLQAGATGGIVVASTRRDGDEVADMAASLGALYADGLDVDWTCYHGPVAPVLDLPPYPWQRSRHWIDAPSGRPGAQRGHRDDPVLGWSVPVADPSVPQLWDGGVAGAGRHGEVPAAHLLELLVRAAWRAGGDACDVVLGRPVMAADDGERPIQTVLDTAHGTVAVHVGVADGWQVAATARVGPGGDVSPEGFREVVELAVATAVEQAGDASLVAVAAGAVVPTGAGVGARRARATVRAVEEPARSWLADVTVVDERDSVVATVRDLLLQPWADASDALEGWTYRFEWQPSPPRETASRDGRWLVVAEPGGAADALAGALGAHASTTVVAPAAVTPEGVADADRIVFLGALDGPVGFPIRGVDLDHAEQVGPAALLALVRAVRATGRDVPVDVVTRGAWAVAPGDGHLSPGQAAVWGLGRAVAEEHPGLGGRRIDLDPAAGSAEQPLQLAAALRRDDRDAELAWRQGTCFAARLVPERPGPAALRLRPDSTCLVTGAFGAVGRPLVEWLAEHGARRVVLLGRTALPPRADWPTVAPDSPAGRRIAFVRRLEGRGLAVHVVAADVADERALRAALHAFAAEGWPPIRAVFHAAAVFGGELLDDLAPVDLHAQMAPKVTGTWALTDALGDLDHLVLFSSVAATLPFPGQAAYAAANAFVEAAAEALAAAGTPAVSIAWPYWEGSDEVPDGEVGQRAGAAGRGYKTTARLLTEGVGMRSIRTGQGLELLGRAAVAGTPRVVVAPVDWRAFAAARGARVPALVGDLVGAPAPGPDAPAAPAGLVAELAAAAPEARPEIAQGAVRRLVGDVVRLAPSRIDDRQPFGSLGFDSLLAIELRNRLEAAVGLAFSATVAWNYPSVRELAAHVLARLDGGAAVAATTGGPSPDATAGDELGAVAAGVLQLSDEDALAALLGGSGS